jgi:hypothetical protein
MAITLDTEIWGTCASVSMDHNLKALNSRLWSYKLQVESVQNPQSWLIGILRMDYDNPTIPNIYGHIIWLSIIPELFTNQGF